MFFNGTTRKNQLVRWFTAVLVWCYVLVPQPFLFSCKGCSCCSHQTAAAETPVEHSCCSHKKKETPKPEKEPCRCFLKAANPDTPILSGKYRPLEKRHLEVAPLDIAFPVSKTIDCTTAHFSRSRSDFIHFAPKLRTHILLQVLII